MNNILKINFGKRKRLASALGLSLDGSRLDGVVLRRTNGALQSQQTFSANLSLDPLTAAPELVAREIRNHLEAAGIRERHCIVGLPLKWILTAHTELPPLPEADAASLLQIESERAFPCDVATLQLADSRCSLSENKKHVTLVGISKSQIEPLIQILTAAKLKPISFSLGLTALQSPKSKVQSPKSGDAKTGTTFDIGLEALDCLALTIGENSVGLQITANGGVAALRIFEGAVENEGGRRALQPGIVAREARITLGQLPSELREKIKRIRIFGSRELARQLADEMELSFEPMGLSVEVVEKFSPGEFGVELPANAPVSAAFALAARRLAEQPTVFEFLPPKPNVLQQFAAKYSSGKLRSAGAIAAAIVIIVGGLFLFQEIQLIHFRSQWSAMSAKTGDLTALQNQIQKYQPWYDDSFRALAILKELTLAFPENGSVTAKTIDIHGGNTITCSGTASDSAALLRTLAQLRAADGVNNVTVEQIRGQSPMEFTFDFQWGYGNGGAQ